VASDYEFYASATGDLASLSGPALDTWTDPSLGDSIFQLSNPDLGTTKNVTLTISFREAISHQHIDTATITMAVTKDNP
jgi:hypothetical protein